MSRFPAKGSAELFYGQPKPLAVQVLLPLGRSNISILHSIADVAKSSALNGLLSLCCSAQGDAQCKQTKAIS